jgi:hypothetical protein
MAFKLAVFVEASCWLLAPFSCWRSDSEATFNGD